MPRLRNLRREIDRVTMQAIGAAGGEAGRRGLIGVMHRQAIRCPMGRRWARRSIELGWRRHSMAAHTIRRWYSEGMITRQIELDEESDRILSSLAEDHGGDAGQAISDLLHSRQGVEAMLDQCETASFQSLKSQKERAERGFREGRFTTWERVRKDNGL